MQWLTWGEPTTVPARGQLKPGKWRVDERLHSRNKIGRISDMVSFSVAMECKLGLMVVV